MSDGIINIYGKDWKSVNLLKFRTIYPIFDMCYDIFASAEVPMTGCELSVLVSDNNKNTLHLV